MTERQEAIAHACLEGAETGSLKFPQIVAQLAEAGFERYAVDFCRGTHTYYLSDGDSVSFETAVRRSAIGERFDVPAMRQAIGEAQQDVPGYSYAGFCQKAMDAGCVGYVVSFPGKRAIYSGRTGDTHVEHFPD